MTAPQKTFWYGVAGAVVAGVLLWLFTTAAGGGIVTGSRFIADSTNRDRDNARRDSLLIRIDSRVGEIYCTNKPPGCR